VQNLGNRNQSISNLRNSFIVRDGKRLPVDFTKLISSADHTGDVLIKPGDYIYIALNDDRDVYVLGAVTVPLAVPFKDEMTLMKALSSAGGWRMGGPFGADVNNVMIIRGELECPVVMCVNLCELLKGNETDVYLQPGDIVYVHNKKFRFGRELVRLAITSFIYAFVNDAGIFIADKLFPISPLSSSSSSTTTNP